MTASLVEEVWVGFSSSVGERFWECGLWFSNFELPRNRQKILGSKLVILGVGVCVGRDWIWCREN